MNINTEHTTFIKKYYKEIIKMVLTVSIIITVAFGLVSYLNVRENLSSKYFYTGIYIDGVNVAGLTKTEALREVKKEFDKNHGKSSINLLFEEKTWILPLAELNFKYDFETTINKAYGLGRTGNWFTRLITIKRLKDTPINLIVASNYDKAKLTKLLTKLKKQVDFSPSNSTYDYNYGKIKYTNEVYGRRLDLETNTKLIEARLMNRDFSDICLNIESIKPLITVDDVKDLNDVLAIFSTNFNSYNSSRAHNIGLAAKKINNYLLLPGEEFSMDRALGPRSFSNGYMQAPIIMRSQVVPGTGGGVCQVATTLYNAALLSCLEITKRVHHSIPLGYVPPGQDATISEGYIDLKFKNNRDYTICIVSEISGGSITVKIIGKKGNKDALRIVLRPVVIEEYAPPEPEYIINNSLSEGQVKVRVRERKGLKVVLYRDVYDEQGTLLNSEIISQDIYKPVRGQLGVSRRTYEKLKNY